MRCDIFALRMRMLSNLSTMLFSDHISQVVEVRTDGQHELVDSCLEKLVLSLTNTNTLSM